MGDKSCAHKTKPAHPKSRMSRKKQRHGQCRALFAYINAGETDSYFYLIRTHTLRAYKRLSRNHLSMCRYSTITPTATANWRRHFALQKLLCRPSRLAPHPKATRKRNDACLCAFCGLCVRHNSHLAWDKRTPWEESVKSVVLILFFNHRLRGFHRFSCVALLASLRTASELRFNEVYPWNP